eukprot:scaffold11924_cov118-Cylindrotheca_fusiformis.AAC.1
MDPTAAQANRRAVPSNQQSDYSNYSIGKVIELELGTRAPYSSTLTNQPKGDIVGPPSNPHALKNRELNSDFAPSHAKYINYSTLLALANATESFFITFSFPPSFFLFPGITPHLVAAPSNSRYFDVNGWTTDAYKIPTPASVLLTYCE